MSRYKVDICGINTSKLKVLTNEENLNTWQNFKIIYILLFLQFLYKEFLVNLAGVLQKIKLYIYKKISKIIIMQIII